MYSVILLTSLITFTTDICVGLVTVFKTDAFLTAGVCRYMCVAAYKKRKRFS